MSKQLQLLLPDEELAEIQKLADRDRLSIEDWVLRALREACEQKPASDSDRKLMALRRAAEYAFPTADIDQMLSEIERGYQI